MDAYKTMTLGTSLSLDNYWHESMTAPRTLAASDYQELAYHTIIMGYLLCKEALFKEMPGSVPFARVIGNIP